MSDTVVTQSELTGSARTYKLRVMLAFFAIYFLWGTTFLGIRIAVEELPPLFAAGTRFFTAGALLFGFMMLRREAFPTRRQWRNLLAIGLLMFVAEYGPLFWAEKFVPSGVVSVLAATIPILTLVIEMLVLRQRRWRASLVISTLLGFAGVGVLVMPGGQQHFGLAPCLAILAGSACWALGSVLSRSMDMPKSRPVTSGATMMLGGAILLALSGAAGDMHPLPHISMRAGLALLYLIVVGSLLAYTAYVWLLSHMPATSVASYAYVNPLVAVALGHFAAGELVTMRTLAGTALVVFSVSLILRRR